MTNNLSLEETYIIIIKDIHTDFTDKLILNRENLKAFQI